MAKIMVVFIVAWFEFDGTLLSQVQFVAERSFSGIDAPVLAINQRLFDRMPTHSRRCQYPPGADPLMTMFRRPRDKYGRKIVPFQRIDSMHTCLESQDTLPVPEEHDDFLDEPKCFECLAAHHNETTGIHNSPQSRGLAIRAKVAGS